MILCMSWQSCCSNRNEIKSIKNTVLTKAEVQGDIEQTVGFLKGVYSFFMYKNDYSESTQRK